MMQSVAPGPKAGAFSIQNGTRMLRGIQKASSNWLGKAVLTVVIGVLAISFAIWGIGDIFRGFGRSTVATIGGTEITVEQFRTIYNERLQQIGRQAGRPITPEQARQLGLDRQIASQLVAEAALDERARQLGLTLADAEVARQIMSDPLFRGPTGGFDRLRFEQLIRNANYTEARFTQEQRRVALRKQLADTVSGGLKAPNVAVNSVHRYTAEERAVEYLVLGAAQAGEIPAPSAEALKTYFDEHKGLFRTPEYRAITTLSLTPLNLAPWIEVSDADARRVYEDRSARYVTAERRSVSQIVFPTAEEAKAAAERIAAGTSFVQVAADRNLSEKDIDLGLVPKSAIVDSAVGNAAFSLKEGETSAPVAGRFGTVLVHVSKIEPERVRPFEDVATEIRQEIALDRARVEVQTKHDKVEDERAAGLRLDEVAKKLGLQVQTIEAMDRSGRNPAGEAIADLPGGADLVPAAFAALVGVETDPLQLPGGGYLWFDVTGVQPSRERNFEEVKDRIEVRWREDQQADVLKRRAAEIVDKLKAGASTADLASAAGVEVKTATDVRRNGSGALSPRAVEAAFAARKGDAVTAEGSGPAERIVLRVTDIKIPPPDPAAADARQMNERVKRALAEDLLTQYIMRLESELGATINTQALSQVVGGGERF